MGEADRNTKKIAIIGISAVFPDSENKDKFWSLIKNGTDAIREIPDSHWNIDDYYNEDKKAKDMTYCKTGGFIKPFDFDPMEFGIAPNNLEAIDSSQLLGLYASKYALIDAGYGKNGKQFKREAVGVVLGVTGAQKLAIDLGARLGHPYWKKAVLDAGGTEEMAEDVKERIGSYYPEWQEQSFPGLLGNVDSGRISNYFDLGGMNCVIDAACASSLGAIDIACTRLLANREYMMLAGGIDTFNDIFMYMCFSKTPAMAPDGHAKPFSENGNGTCLGEGAGIVVLKRYEDALKDGDKIYAIIDGIGSGSDGKGASVFAPQEKGQVLTIKRAYESAGINPLTVGLIEAHGTGTKVGDGIEVNSLMSVFDPYGKGDRNCAVGSVKSQIGHCKAAAGVAGLIKIALSLYNKVLPPTIKANPPLKTFRDENCHFYVNTTKRPWISDGSYPRRAGVSAFGFGGTNFHCVLEEFDQDKKYIDWDSSIQIITFSADSKSEISNDIKNITNLSWEDFCKKADSNRKTFSKDKKYILTAVVKSEDYNSSNLVQKLSKVLDDEKSSPFSEGIFFSDKSINGKISAIFPGQGSQKPNMLLDIACLFPEAVKTFDNVEKEFKKANSYYLSDVVYPFERYGVEKDFLKIITDTKNAQPALGAVSLGVAKVLKYFGFNPVATAGHSYGELPSLCFAGKISEEDFAKISVLRGQLMSSSKETRDRGSMCAVMTDYHTLSDIIKEENLDLIIANVNAPKQMVLSGKTSEIEKAVKVISARGITAKQLKVSAAFHSSLVSDALIPFSKAVDNVDFKKSDCDVYSNMTSYKYEIGKEKELLAKQLANPVLFANEITNMYNDGIRLFVECGPGAKMTGLINNILADKNDYEAISVNSSNGKRNSVFDLALLLARLGTLRLDIDFSKWNPLSKEEKKPKFTVKISGANYRKKKVIPPSNIKYVDSSKIEPQKVVVYKEVSKEKEEKRQEKDMNGKFNSEIIDLISQMQSQTADLHRRFLENQRAVIDSIRISLSGNQVPVPVQNISISKPVISPVIEEIPKQKIKVEETVSTPKVTEIVETKEDSRDIKTSQNDKINQDISNGQAKSIERILDKVIEISADKTGYPKDMLSPEMDMESDLGIDSIKKVEIFSSLKDSIPEMPSITASDMGQIRTLKEASEYIASRLPIQKVTETKKEVKNEQANQERILEKVIEISADKTGYPKDMLSPEMDMESDLGIDSIKKVEIFSSLKDSIPEMPSITASDMGQIRTLKEASEYIASRLPAQKVAEPAQKVEDTKENSRGIEEILNKVIEISAEKTGYPKDMLSPEMDMESDLGIDSIKKVEIFSSLKDSIPEMPSITASDMGQIRTLKEASEYIASRLPAQKVVEPAQKEQKSEASQEKILEKVIEISAEKTGYPKDMLSPEMDMESDLGIDSIKKVEIFSSLKDSIPEMPSITASDMGQIRTLKEASEYIASRLPVQKVTETKKEVKNEQASQEKILEKVIEISAEKTGYPKDMLSPEMDMESDLGIDSIKKVEIFSSLKDSIPKMPSITASDMGQIRTLKEASEYIASRLPVQKVEETKKEVKNEQTSQEKILEKVIEISAEKTGYPKDMLSPEMDMESDLGIDSIKKVEIFSSLKDSIPEMPSITASDMGQIRTLKEASEYIASRIKPTQTEEPTKNEQENQDNIEEETISEENNIKRISLKLVDVDINKKVPFTGKLYVVSSNKSDMTVGIIESGFKKYDIEVVSGTFDEKIPDDVQGLIFAGNFSKDVNTDIQTKAFALLKDFLVKGGQFVASVSFIDGQFGLSKNMLSAILKGDKTSNLGVSPVFGGFAGLIKTALLEYPTIHAKAVDFDFQLIDDVNKTSLIADVIMSTNAVEVGISVDGIKTIKLEETEQEKNVVFDKFEKDDVVLVFGGGRGVTYSCLYEFAKSLPEDKRPCWVIVGRTDIDIKEKSYTSSLTEEKDIKRALMQNEGLAPKLAGKEFKRIKAVREIISNIEKLRKFSSDVKYISADTSVEKSVVELIDKARNFGKIVGLIHGAGVLADKKIENKTTEDFTRVLQTKANSAIYALKYLEDLKLLAFFSSSTARFGRIGQIDYSVGNEILNKIADFYKSTHKNTVVKSFNWGPWDGGMVDEGLKKLFASEGIGVIPLKEGGKFFAREIASKNDEVEIVVLVELDREEKNDSDSFKVTVEKNISIAEFPILKNHIINGKVVFPVALASELMVEATLSAYPGYFLRGFDEFKVNSGIKISEKEELKSRILIENLSSYSNELKLKVHFETLTNTGKYKNNFSVNVLLSSSRPTSKNVETETLNGEYGEKDFYEILFHGEDLQGIDEIEAIDKKGIFAFLNSKSSPSKWIKSPLRSKWVTDPFSLDCAFQAMILWTKRYLNKISLPCYLGEFRQYKNFVGNDVKVRAYIKDKIGDDIISADIYFLDKNNSLIAQIVDYRCVCTDSIK